MWTHRNRRYSILLIIALFLMGCSNETKTDMYGVEQSPALTSEDVATAESLAMLSDITPQLSKKIEDKEKENPDTVGWLIVPGTPIDEVIVQNPKDNKSYYTTHDFWGNSSKTAAFSVDYRCDFTLSDRKNIPNNIALYGHSFDENPDGELFSQIKKYKDPVFAQTHPYIFFSTSNEDMAWEVFAVFDTSANLPYIIPNLSWDTLSNVLDVVYKASLYNYGVTITKDDTLLTLSCCTFSVPGKEPLPFDIPNNYRFVVMARLVSPDQPIKESAFFTRNDAPLKPDMMPMIFHSGQDIFMYNGVLYMEASDVEWLMQLDLTNGIPLGRIKRTDITMNLQDWDAVSLKPDTQVLRHPEETDVLIAIVNGIETPYIPV